ncbi:hypothetical protein G6M50_36780 [Agrobacterium rhizogenes]|nr:hypothetical protein [Rhizobium rhizogenes]NTJ83343.1 hypothetical protein [Rhizobium rhizogenes]
MLEIAPVAMPFFGDACLLLGNLLQVQIETPDGALGDFCSDAVDDAVPYAAKHGVVLS